MTTTDYLRQAQRNYSYSVAVDLAIEECYRCHIVFGMPADFQQRALRDRSIEFYCPNGHSQHYIGESKEKQLKRLLDGANARATSLADQLEAEKRSKAALKGALTKAKKRAGAGLCPVEGCKRHFQNLQRHVASQHPDLLKTIQ